MCAPAPPTARIGNRSRSAVGIIVRCIAHATSARGGGRQALTRPKLPAGSGNRRAEWDSGGLNEQHYLGRMALPRPLSHPQEREHQRHRNAARRNPVSGLSRLAGPGAAGCSRIVTMWRPNEPAEDDDSDLPGIDPQSKRRRSRRALGVLGLATKPSSRLSKTFDLTERSSAPSSAVLILDR